MTLATVGIQTFIGRTDNTNAASFATGPVAPDSIASLFGVGLAESQATAASRPLPTTLAGATVTIIDSLGAERTGSAVRGLTRIRIQLSGAARHLRVGKRPWLSQLERPCDRHPPQSGY